MSPGTRNARSCRMDVAGVSTTTGMRSGSGEPASRACATRKAWLAACAATWPCATRIAVQPQAVAAADALELRPSSLPSPTSPRLGGAQRPRC